MVHRGQTRHGHTVAVKRLELPLPAGHARFEHEVRLLAGLSHPHVIPIHAAKFEEDATGRRAFIVMHLAAGGSLAEAPSRWLRAHGPELLTQLAGALAHVHARGFLHGDVKPSNLLLEAAPPEEPHLWLADLGHGRVLGTSDDLPAAGTLHTMAPEQLQARWRDSGPWTDVYSLGVVAYRWLTGRWPFPQCSEPRRTLIARMRGPAPTGLGADVDRVIASLLAPDPAARVRHAADALAMLLSIWPSVAPDAAAAPRAAAALTSTIEVREALTVEREPTPALGAAARTAAPAHVEHPWRGWRERTAAPQAPVAGAGVGLGPHRRTALVGREPERDRLWDLLESVSRDGQGAIVELVGPPGAGKTALAGWLAERAYELGLAEVLVVEPGLGGMRRALLARMNAEGLQGPVLAARVRASLAAWGADALTVQGAAQLLTGTAAADARDRRDVLRELLRCLAARRPLVVVRDPDDGAPDDLAEVGATDSGRGILWVRCRDDAGDATGDGEDADVARMPLGPLPEPAMVAFLRSLAGLTEHLARIVAGRVGGNPGYGRALIEEWIATGVLVAEADGFVLDRPDPPLPGSVQALWRQRVDRLMGARTEPQRRALQVAALLARELPTGGWSDGDEVLRASLRTLKLPSPDEAFAGLAVDGLASPTPDGWRFEQSPVRDLLVEAAARSGWMVRAARAVAAAADRAAPGPARDTVRAACLLRAGAVDEAVEALPGPIQAAIDPLVARHAVGLLDRLEEAAREWPGRLRKVLGARAEAYWALGDHRRARQDASRVTATDPDDPSAAWVLAHLALTEGDLQQAEGWLEHLAGGALGGRERTQVQVARGKLALLQGRWADAERALAPAIQAARKDGTPRLLCRALILRSEVHQGLGAFREAAAALDEAEALARHLGSKALLTHALLDRGEVAALEGDWEAAALAAEKACEVIGDQPPLSCYAQGNRAAAALALGRVSEAEGALEIARAPAVARRPGRLWLFIEALQLAVDAFRRRGRPFDRRLDALERFVASSDVWLDDCRRSAEWAAAAWLAVRDGERARRALAFAETPRDRER